MIMTMTMTMTMMMMTMMMTMNDYGVGSVRKEGGGRRGYITYKFHTHKKRHLMNTEEKEKERQRQKKKKPQKPSSSLASRHRHQIIKIPHHLPSSQSHHLPFPLHHLGQQLGLKPIRMPLLHLIPYPILIQPRLVRITLGAQISKNRTTVDRLRIARHRKHGPWKSVPA